jgi:D-beta-D-heptose 7-phosphate kinase/D-beta-D-heptose 1-phosphate adenosyltransferase
MKIVVVSGGFDPIHIGHVRYLQEARELGDRLVVILNSDEFLQQKKGRIFMSFPERMMILNAIRFVDDVVKAIDRDQSVCLTLGALKMAYLKDEMIFAKGGDRTLGNIPEKKICEDLDIKMIFGVGGGKIQSSSELV